MARPKRRKTDSDKEFFSLARELRVQLHEIDQKLEHLIRSHRHFYSLHYKERELND
jgi:hypothetical protein